GLTPRALPGATSTRPASASASTCLRAAPREARPQASAISARVGGWPWPATRSRMKERMAARRGLRAGVMEYICTPLLRVCLEWVGWPLGGTIGDMDVADKPTWPYLRACPAKGYPTGPPGGFWHDRPAFARARHDHLLRPPARLHRHLRLRHQWGTGRGAAPAGPVRGAGAGVPRGHRRRHDPRRGAGGDPGGGGRLALPGPVDRRRPAVLLPPRAGGADAQPGAALRRGGAGAVRGDRVGQGAARRGRAGGRGDDGDPV